MTDTKPWFLSRTIWASGVSIALAMAGFLGLAPAGLDHAMLTDAAVEIVSALAGVIAIIGRLRATARIG